MTLRQWVLAYELPSTNVMTEAHWQLWFDKFKRDCLTFKASAQYKRVR